MAWTSALRHTPTDDRCFDWLARLRALPGGAAPSTEKRNDISADVILAKEFKRLIRGWFAVVNKSVDACLACGHATEIVLPIGI